MKRREFLIAGATTGALSLGLGGCEKDGSFIDSSKKTTKNVIKIRLATSWPSNFPIMGEGVDFFARTVNAMSGGSLEVKVYPMNKLVPALGVFDATSSGQIDAFHSGPYYWKGKNSAFSLFSGFPFGHIENELSSWLNFGGGFELWRELYAKHNLYPMLCGSTSVQMGGWFKKEIKGIDDIKGLKMRIPGLGGEVLSKLGASPVLLPAGDIYLALDRGVIDASEWVGPALDYKMGFYKVAPYYYTGWHEPGSTLELSFNLRFWNKLSSEHKLMLESVAAMTHQRMVYDFFHQNTIALQTIKNNPNIFIKNFPQDVIDGAKKALFDVVEESSLANKDFKKVWESSYGYLQKAKMWTNIGEKEFFNIRL